MGTLGGYSRVSTQEQADSGLSLEAQHAALERHAESEGAELVSFADPGCSGAKRDGRIGLAAMMAAAARGELTAVVVTRLDRLARDTADALQIAAELEAAGVALVDLSCPMEPAGAFGRFTFALRASVAALERDLIAERTSAALQAKRARGEWTGGRCAVGLRQEGAHLVADPDGLAIVECIGRMRETGLSLRKIALALDLSGVPTARGGRWQAETVRKLLNNPRLNAIRETEAEEAA